VAATQQADAWVLWKHRALAAQQAGHLQEALDLYDQALAAAPTDFDCLHMAGVAHFQNGDLERALQLIDRAIAANPAVEAAHFNHRLVCAAMERREVEAELARVTQDGGWLGPRELPADNAPPADTGVEHDARTRVIAFYLPQYHAIPENDAWWGKGFTEWTNVRRARPNFAGHWQPHEPGELGYYDLTDPTVREAQAELARAYGIDAFCYYYYWFGGKRLLERPLLDMAESGRPDFPFCVCWANENWTRRWDGRDREILIAQSYSRADSVAFIRSLFPLFRDRRYVTVDGRPLLAVYKIGDIPQTAATAALWRETCRREGVGEIYLAAVQHRAHDDPTKVGFDAAIEFPPIGHSAENLTPRLTLINGNFQGHVFRYASIAAHYLTQPEPTFVQFRGVTRCGTTPRVARIMAWCSPIQVPACFASGSSARSPIRDSATAAMSVCCSSTRGTNGGRATTSSRMRAMDAATWKPFARRGNMNPLLSRMVPNRIRRGRESRPGR
jgi:hypothetical protein